MKFPIIAIIGLFTIPGVVAIAQTPAAPVVEVFKSPTCGCCAKWVDHLKAAGFTTKVTELNDEALDALKAKRGVPRTAQSCHTAVIGNYVVEGHVPASEVKRLIKERPAVAGIAVAGMPLGSPGMEVPGQKPQTYNVVSFDKMGATKIFSTQNAK
ncbi:MAG TPA: DUF411 domain-containing protein [Vicinamibacterales bacterium]|nr:DUF411 domain-containing protein [Vicinamibacterales bacterium]